MSKQIVDSSFLPKVIEHEGMFLGQVICSLHYADGSGEGFSEEVPEGFLNTRTEAHMAAEQHIARMRRRYGLELDE